MFNWWSSRLMLSAAGDILNLQWYDLCLLMTCLYERCHLKKKNISGRLSCENLKSAAGDELQWSPGRMWRMWIYCGERKPRAGPHSAALLLMLSDTVHPTRLNISSLKSRTSLTQISSCFSNTTLSLFLWVEIVSALHAVANFFPNYVIYFSAVSSTCSAPGEEAV